MVKNIESKIRDLFSGKFREIPEQNSSLVRLFISSTNSGMYSNHS